MLNYVITFVIFKNRKGQQRNGTMIVYNGLKFAESEKEFTDSLFSKKTCSGYAKRFKRKIMFYNIRMSPIACINKYGCLSGANEQEVDGKKVVWYSYCLPDYMKTEDGSFISGYNTANKYCARKEYKNELEYWFK